MNGNNSISRKKNQSNPIRRRISKSRSQWRWLQRIHGWLIEDEWSRKEGHLAEQERGIDSISEEFLSKATLDWIDDPFSPSFNFEIPNTKSCGCGNSFTLEEK